MKSSDRAAIKSSVYKLLSKGFIYPEKDLFLFYRKSYVNELGDALAQLNYSTQFAKPLEKLEKILKNRSQEQTLEEFERVFERQSESKCPIFETDYTKETPQHGFSQTYELSDIAGFYKAFGLEINKNNKERVDSIGVELEFMHFLALKEAIAREKNETKNMKICADAERKFLEDHLGRWTDAFYKYLKKNSGSKFYTIMGNIVDIFVGLDAENVGANPEISRPMNLHDTLDDVISESTT